MSRVIEVKGTNEEGLGHTTRLWIKSYFEQFGEVAQVHKPPSSGDPETDVAFVRFVKDADAEKVVEILRAGTEMSNGTPIKGDWKPGGGGKGGGKGGRPSSGVVDFNAPTDDSRSLATGRSRRSRSRGGRHDRNRNDRDSRRSESRSRRDNTSKRRSSSRDGRGRQDRDNSRTARRGGDRGSRRSPSRSLDRGRSDRKKDDRGSRDDRNGGSRRDDSRNR